MDQDEGNNSVAPEPTTAPVSREVSEPLLPKEESKPATPKPHPLSVSFQPSPSPPPQDDGLDESLKPAEDMDGLNGVIDGLEGMEAELALDMATMGPDGEAFEASGDLSQLQATDALLGGGPLLDEAIEDDPFAGQSS
jgi:hypothetical protein